MSKKAKVSIYEVNQTNDIKFRGPFSYRHLRVFGWTFLALAALGTVIGIFNYTTNNQAGQTASTILKFLSSLGTPLFIIACLAQIMTVKDGYRKLILVYALGYLGIYALFIVLYGHFLVGFATAITGAATRAESLVAQLTDILAKNGFFAFNIFADLLMCALMMYFVNYHPKKLFQGKWISIFRGMAFLPFAYEVASIVLKVLATNGNITLSPYLFPLLTTKPPVSFLIFVALAIFIKAREQLYLKKGKTYEEYQEFLNTNVNRAQVAKFLIVSIIGAAIIDIIVSLIAISCIAHFNEEIEIYPYYVLVKALRRVNAWGLGGCSVMVLIIPILAFFDYRKTYKSSLPNIIIPTIGCAVIALIYIEGIFQYISYLIDYYLRIADKGGEPIVDALSRQVSKVTRFLL